MTIRRRPIPCSSYSWSPSPKKPNVLRFQIIENGALRVYTDSLGNVIREVWQDNALGRRLYQNRVAEMVQRQNYRCSLCNQRLSLSEATFEHQRRRGMGGAFRDDRVIDVEGNWMNSAAHWVCNRNRG